MEMLFNWSSKKAKIAKMAKIIPAGLCKSRTCVRDVLEIINFTNCHICVFDKYAHEYICSVFWVLEAILIN